ncbi:MAG: glutamine amidotransferase, partial [Verrucomicrobiae bacterium]|nr:glutamine amidotransferase [Verrucomicrobiae bacterium]
YRGTPLETILPVEMELSSKKVLPNGAVVLIMHGMEFNNGNQVARECAQGVLDALGPQDELGVVLWDGRDRWLFPLSKVGNKKEMGRMIAGMNQGDLPTFQHVMEMAFRGSDGNPGLLQSTANLKHIIVFSDGDPAAPSENLMNEIVQNRITVSTVLIAGHAGPETMIRIAELGGGRFYAVNNPDELPQIFLKEAMVILKSAIFEEPFQPQLVVSTEPVRGISPAEVPMLRGYVCTTPKSRAEVPLVSDKGDPVLAHWQFGLGRAVAFTSDAKAKWAVDWLGWPQYRQFWTQVAQWALRRLENADFSTEISVEDGRAILTVEALDQAGNYRNFLDLRAVVVSPRGDRQSVRLEQTGPGRYETRFDTRESGTYLVQVLEFESGRVRASQVVGACVNYAPEFSSAEPNRGLLARIAATGGGRLLDLAAPDDPDRNPFLHDRERVWRAVEMWEWLLKLAIIMFVADVGVRRIDIDRAEWLRATANLRRLLFFWRRKPVMAEAEVSLSALLARRDEVRAKRTGVQQTAAVEALQREASRTEPLSSEAGPGERKAAPAQPVAAPSRTETTSRLLEAKRRARNKLEK